DSTGRATRWAARTWSSPPRPPPERFRRANPPGACSPNRTAVAVRSARAPHGHGAGKETRVETLMRAVVQTELGGPEVLTLTEIPRPEPGPGEILVRVEAAGVNPIDCKTRASGGLLRASPPFTVGWDVSGVVEAVGRGVRLHRVGDEVYGMPSFPRFAGGYAEYVAAPARHFDRKPAGLSHIEAAALPLAALTARQALVDTAGLGAGLRVLVHAGAGGVGHLAVQIAGSLGAFVIATASPRKTGFVRKLGADVVLDYTAADFAADLADVDVVLDAVG